MRARYRYVYTDIINLFTKRETSFHTENKHISFWKIMDQFLWIGKYNCLIPSIWTLKSKWCQGKDLDIFWCIVQKPHSFQTFHFFVVIFPKQFCLVHLKISICLCMSIYYIDRERSNWNTRPNPGTRILCPTNLNWKSDVVLGP